MRTETLQESSFKILTLTEDQAIALQTTGRALASNTHWWGDDPPEDRSPIHCLRVGDGQWRVAVYNAVGLISIGGLQLHVEPKIPAEHLLYLFAKSGAFPRIDNISARGLSGFHLWELVAHWYVAATRKLLRGELIRDYQLIADALPTIRGRTALLPATLAVYRGRLQFPSEFDEFAADTPLNRTIKAAAGVIVERSMRPETRLSALTLLAQMAEVGSLRTFDESVTLDRRTRHYTDCLALARHILRYQGRIIEAGEVTAWTFLIPTPNMIERGIFCLLQEHLHPRWKVEKKGMQLPRTTLTFNPDLLFNGGLAVGDVKYKLSHGEWNRHDLYQIVAFSTAYRAAHGALVTFRPPNTTPLPTLTIGDIQITELSWPAEPSLSPQDAAHQLCAAAASWLTTIQLALPNGDEIAGVHL